MMKSHQKTNMLYAMQGSTITGATNVASRSLSKDDITNLWHMRLGHMCENGLAKLSRRGLLDGKKTSKL